MKQIKLIIWDLDETYWRGTLSEGPITYMQQHHDTIVELSRRGIVNSICSKNSFKAARQVLVEHGVWDWFVFPRIAWEPKGQMIAAIIRDMQLRPENVLFIDDNHLNLEEAKFFCTNLQTAGPGIIGSLLRLDACRGKDDARITRLKQYKLLEQKTQDQKESLESNEDFLRSCAITVRVGHDCSCYRDRLLELINRTNQLNYTKCRLSAAGMDALLADSSIETAYVQVSDRYGDYGLCGFYALRGGSLEHFLFSCRILNMGVENWLYHKLGCPKLEPVGEVVTPLDPDMYIDWIAQTDVGAPKQAAAASPAADLGIIIKGGCDLQQVQSYLKRTARFDAEVDYVSDAGYRINNSHSEILRRAHHGTLDRYGAVIDKVRFFDRQAFATRFFDSGYSVRIYSVLDDYTRSLYRYLDTDFVVPFGDLESDLTDEALWDWHADRSPKHRLDRDFLAWFRENFTCIGPIDPEAFKRNIAWLCGSVDPDDQLIILNGSEVAYERNPQGRRWERHRFMNAALAEATAPFDHAEVCDVRKCIVSPQDHSHNIRHYTRQGYYRIARALNDIIARRIPVRADDGGWFRQALRAARVLDVRQALRNLF